jgi:hypothetical protein
MNVRRRSCGVKRSAVATVQARVPEVAFADLHSGERFIAAMRGHGVDTVFQAVGGKSSHGQLKAFHKRGEAIRQRLERALQH